jgi:hypothetical protein
VEYSLRDIGKTMGISDYHLTQAIPQSLQSKLPTIEELEDELAKRLSDAHEEVNEDEKRG